MLQSVLCLGHHDAREQSWTDSSQNVLDLQGSHSPDELGEQRDCEVSVSLDFELSQALNGLAAVDKHALHHLELAWLEEGTASTAFRACTLLASDSVHELSSRHQVPHHFPDGHLVGLSDLAELAAR